MKQSVGVIRLLKRQRGLGLLCLCILLALLGNRQMKQSAVQTSSRVGLRELPIYSVDTQRQEVALTFEAAGESAGVRAILEALQDCGVHATFFVTQDWVLEHPQMVQELRARGHELGNHGISQKSMCGWREEEIVQVLRETHAQVEQLAATKMHLFRAPYGDYDNCLIRAAAKCGYDTIQWSVDSLDWKDYGADAIVQNVKKSKALENGAILRFHTAAKYTAEALPQLVEALREMGYGIVPVSELLHEEPYHMDASGRQIAG